MTAVASLSIAVSYKLIDFLFSLNMKAKIIGKKGE